MSRCIFIVQVEFGAHEGMACCHGAKYNAHTHICCNKLVHNRGPKSQCCASTLLYNIDLQVCCEGKLSNHDNAKRQFCGVTAYDGRSGLMACCNKTVYNKSLSFCCNNHQPYLNALRALSPCA